MTEILLHSLPATERRYQTPVLLVPGAFTAGWIWEDNFLPWFAEAGFDTHALSFRGHGQSLWGQARYGLDDHCQELLAAIDALPGPPIVVGYSLGGLVTALALAERDVAAAVLLSPVPLSGLARSILRYGRDYPISAGKLASLSLFPPVRYLSQAPAGIYSDTMPAARQKATTRRLSREPLAALLATLRPRPAFTPTCPVLVIGAEGDHLIPPLTVMQAARDLEAPCQIYPGMSHSLMLEPEAPGLFADILGWLELKGLCSESAVGVSCSR